MPYAAHASLKTNSKQINCIYGNKYSCSFGDGVDKQDDVYTNCNHETLAEKLKMYIKHTWG